MILHVYETAKKANVEEVYVATPDQKIIDLINENGGKAVKTSSNHETGTDRIYEVFQNQLKSLPSIIVNLQGDMPYFSDELIKNTLDLMNDKNVDIATSAVKLKEINRNNKNVVKVRVKMDKNKKGFAKDFFRESSSSNHLYHHIGIYLYTSYSLRKFISLSQ